MFFSRPIQWYHSHVDPIWPDGTFKGCQIMMDRLPRIIHKKGDPPPEQTAITKVGDLI